MSGITERQLFAAYGVEYGDPIEPEPVRPVRVAHVLSAREIRQRVAVHQDRLADERALAVSRAERERVAS